MQEKQGSKITLKSLFKYAVILFHSFHSSHNSFKMNFLKQIFSDHCFCVFTTDQKYSIFKNDFFSCQKISGLSCGKSLIYEYSLQKIKIILLCVFCPVQTHFHFLEKPKNQAI
jgi:hypothetical protein